MPSAETEANKANIRRYVDEALNRGILDVIDETRGELAEHAKMKVLAWRTAFPDFHTTIETLVAEDDWVAYNVRHQGTHEGEFEGVAPTGKRVEFRTMVFNRFADGIAVENWGLHDHASVLAQLPRRVVRHGQALLRLVRVGSGRRFSFHVHPNVLRVQLQPKGVRDSRRLLAGSSARSRVAHRTTKGLGSWCESTVAPVDAPAWISAWYSASAHTRRRCPPFPPGSPRARGEGKRTTVPTTAIEGGHHE